MNSRSAPLRSGLQAKGPSPAELLAKMPRKPLTPEEQLAALDKVQAQATQRIKLGQQLFKAAEARLTQHQEVLDHIRNQQQELRDQVQDDVAKSLQSYDQWMGQIDESFTGAIRELNERLGKVEQEQQASREEMHSMVTRATALMEQTQRLLMDAFGDEGGDEQAAGAASQPNALESAVLNQRPLGASAEQTEPIDAEQPPAPAPLPMNSVPEDEGEHEDVFGQVLQRLRETDEDDAAAA